MMFVAGWRKKRERGSFLSLPLDRGTESLKCAKEGVVADVIVMSSLEGRNMPEPLAVLSGDLGAVGVGRGSHASG